MSEIVENEIDWYVAFADRKQRDFWDVFTCQGFRHCFAFRWDGFNWILVDPLSSWLEIQVMPYGPKDNVPVLMEQLGNRVCYVKRSRRNKVIFRGMMTCVSTIKHLLGIRRFWVVTPRQLFKQLTKE